MIECKKINIVSPLGILILKCCFKCLNFIVIQKAFVFSNWWPVRYFKIWHVYAALDKGTKKSIATCRQNDKISNNLENKQKLLYFQNVS